MTQIQEAPIIHGTVSVSRFVANSVHFELGSVESITAVDTTLDINSSNPITNTATKAAIDAIIPPQLSVFSVALVQNTDNSLEGDVVFSHPSQNISTFVTGGVTNNTSVIVPAAGVYHVYSATTAATQSNELGISVKVNNVVVKTTTAFGSLHNNTVLSLNDGDSISLEANTPTISRTSLSVTLLKPAATP